MNENFCYAWNNLHQLYTIDPEVFAQDYAKNAQRSDGRQVILVTSDGQSLDGMIHKFIGKPLYYRGHWYASINPFRPHACLSKKPNKFGLLYPICCFKKCLTPASDVDVDDSENGLLKKQKTN